MKRFQVDAEPDQRDRMVFHERPDLVAESERRVNSSLLYAIRVIEAYSQRPFDEAVSRVAGKGRPAPQGQEEQPPAEKQQGRRDQ